MQHHHFTLGALLASLTLFPAAAIAAPQVSAGRVSAGRVSVPQSSAGIDALIDATLLDLDVIVARKQAALGQLVLLSDLLDQSTAADMPSFPSAAAIRVRLQAHLDALIERARFTFVSALEVSFLREQFIEARLDRALYLLMVRARTTGWSHEAYDEVVAQLVARARVAVGHPDVEMYRVRLQSALEEARAMATHSAQRAGLARALSSLHLELIRSRLMRAYQYVTQRARFGKVSREDTMRILELLVLRARMAATQPFPG